MEGVGFGQRLFYKNISVPVFLAVFRPLPDGKQVHAIDGER